MFDDNDRHSTMASTTFHVVPLIPENISGTTTQLPQNQHYYTAIPLRSFWSWSFWSNSFPQGKKVPQYIIKNIFFIIIVSRKRHPIFNLTNLTLTNLTTSLKKFFEKSCSKIRRAHFQCRTFVPDLKVKGSSDCSQTVVRGSEINRRSKRADVRVQMADGE